MTTYLHNFYNFCFILSFYNFYISEPEAVTDFFLDEGDSDFFDDLYKDAYKDYDTDPDGGIFDS